MVFSAGTEEDIGRVRTGKTKNIGVVLFIGCNQYGLQAQWEAIRGDEFFPHQMLQAIVINPN